MERIIEHEIHWNMNKMRRHCFQTFWVQIPACQQLASLTARNRDDDTGPCFAGYFEDSDIQSHHMACGR